MQGIISLNTLPVIHCDNNSQRHNHIRYRLTENRKKRRNEKGKRSLSLICITIHNLIANIQDVPKKLESWNLSKKIQVYLLSLSV